LGYYANADTTRQLPASFLGGLVSRVALPMFSRANGDVATYRRGIQLAIRMMMLINAPVVAVMVALASPLLQVAFGKQWLPAAPLLQILALAVLFFPLHAINLQALMSTGQARLMVRLEVIKKCIGVLLLLVGARYGLAGIAWSQVAHSVVALAINTYFTRRWFGYGTIAQLRDVLPSLLAALGAGLVAGVLARAWDLPVAWNLLACLAAGALVFLALIAVFGRGTWRDARELAMELRK
jgi:O-antigen/teichoic acid export membrane protein